VNRRLVQIRYAARMTEAADTETPAADCVEQGRLDPALRKLIEAIARADARRDFAAMLGARPTQGCVGKVN